MRHYPNRYKKQACLGIVGLTLIASPLFLKLPSQFSAFNAANEAETQVAKQKVEISSSEQVERSRIQERKETADVLQKAGVRRTIRTLTLRKYYDNKKHDPKPETTSFLATDRVQVFDSTGRCIGKIQNRKWYWKHYYSGVCNK